MRARRIAVLAVLVTTAVRASGTLTIVAPAAPGGGWDQTARALQLAFASVEPGARVQVDNVAGAAGTIGLARFVSAERGNPEALLITGLVMVSGITTNHSPVTLADTTPIARLTGESEVIVVPAASPLRTFADLLEAFRTSPASVAWGGGSAGGTDDLLVRLLAEAIGVAPNRANYIAFSGGGAALAALLGGQVTAGVSGYGEFAGQIEAGTLRPLAVSSATRVRALDVPTLREQGVDLDLSNWRGIVAPPGLTDRERDEVTARVARVASSDAWKAICERYGWEDMLLTGAPFRQFLLAEQSRVNAVLRRLDAGSSAPIARRALTPTPQTAPLVIFAGLVVLIALTAIRFPQRGRVYSTRLQTSSNLVQLDVDGGPLDRSAPTKTARIQQNAELDPTPLWKSGDGKALALAGVLAMHAVAMPVIGFIPAGTGLFVAATGLFGSRRWRRNFAIGAATTTALYVGFTSGLGMTLPADPVTEWLRR